MCGIAGTFDLVDRRPPDRDVLDRMNVVQRHRGPDEATVHAEPGLGFAHRRLSIIDIAEGHQPITNERGDVLLIYNGEMYNFQELTVELKALGHRFRTHSDTEVIVHAWEEWGEACVRRFRGMFAFALWDRSRESLFLARDRLGIKPLHYAVLPGGTLLFGSELKAILAHPDTPRRFDPRAVEDYFAYGYVPEPRTILDGVWKLPPGHTLLARRGSPVPSPSQYWDVPFATGPAPSLDDACHELIERLRECVRIRLIAEVPLGAFLSGGVDSSAVVAMMAGLSPEPVTACSIAFTDQEFNEEEYAKALAKRYHVHHMIERVESDDFDLVDRLASFYDEPFADSSAMPTYRVCELARKYVTVALSGDGGDENVAGYRRYRWHLLEERMRSLLPRAIRRPVFGALGAVYPKADWAPKPFRAKSTLEGIARDSVEGYFHSVSILSDAQRARLFTPGFRATLGGYRAVEVLERHAAASPTRDPLSLVQYLDLKTYLVGDILTKVDRASMAHSLEVRVPFLDHTLVEWLSNLPTSLKLRGREGKFFLKRALEPHVPRDLLYRPKMGFSIPLAAWFRGPLRSRVREEILEGPLGDLGIVDRDYARSLIDRHQSGVGDHSAALWSLLMFASSVQAIAGAPEGAAEPAAG
ncbi:MAG TPA: XrtA/PEP-CTERM system amidotransferase [Candidatus Eisenbacteria bacterium]